MDSMFRTLTLYKEKSQLAGRLLPGKLPIPTYTRHMLNFSFSWNIFFCVERHWPGLVWKVQKLIAFKTKLIEWTWGVQFAYLLTGATSKITVLFLKIKTEGKCSNSLRDRCLPCRRRSFRFHRPSSSCHRHTLQNHLAPKSHLCSPDSHLCFTWVSPLLSPVSYKYLHLLCVPLSLATITLHSSLQTTFHCWLMGFCWEGGYTGSKNGWFFSLPTAFLTFLLLVGLVFWLCHRQGLLFTLHCKRRSTAGWWGFVGKAVTLVARMVDFFFLSRQPSLHFFS